MAKIKRLHHFCYVCWSKEYWLAVLIPDTVKTKKMQQDNLGRSALKWAVFIFILVGA
jgi:hypothetical protein